MRNIGVRLLIFGALSYIAVLLTLVCFQRSLLYIRGAEGTKTPADFGLPFERLSITAKDGTHLAAWHIANRSVPDAVMLVYFQGNFGGLSDRAKVTPLFERLGVQTLMATYRGYGNSERGPTDGPTEDGLTLDGQAVYDYAKKSVPESKIFIWGHSLGAAVAAKIASQNHPAGLILESPFSTIYAMASERYPWLLLQPWMLCDKWNNIESVAARKMPLMVLVAENDTIIPHSMGLNVYEAANQPKDLILMHGIDHNDLPENFGLVEESVREWIRGAISTNGDLSYPTK